MKNINFFLIYILIIFNASTIYSQNIIESNILIDSNGEMAVDEILKGVDYGDTLLFNSNISLKGNDEKLINKVKYKNEYFKYKNIDGKVSYTIITPESSYHNFFFHDSIYFISANYLGLAKEKFNEKKVFDLKIKLSEEYPLIYPKEEDLNETFYNAPPIIAGKFDDFIYNDFCVYVRENIEYNKERMNAVLSIIDNAFNHFQNIFSNKHKNIEIVFLPFKSKIAGKNFDNIIVLNENILTNSWLNKKTPIHEVLHSWWGDNDVKFENTIITEAICEYLTLDYLSYVKEFKYLEHQLDYKKNKIKETETYDLRHNQINKTNLQKLYSYDLLPLLMWKKRGKININKILIDFYNNNKASFISYEKGQIFIKSIKIPISSN